MDVTKFIKPLVQEYEKWVGLNPCTSAEIESAVKYLSYLFTSKFENSNILSELIYSLSKLLVLFNDQIIFKRTVKRDTPNPYENKFKKWLTIINHCEVFIEISAQKAWGTRGKWLIIFVIQLFKSVLRLSLLYFYEEQIVESVPINPLDRRNLLKTEKNNFSPQAVSLKTGKVIRTVETAPSVENRNWKALSSQPTENSQDKKLNDDQIRAEIIYIMKPLIHLGSMYYFGDKSWKSWLLAFSLDITSLRFMVRTEKNDFQKFSKRQQAEVFRRTYSLLLYLMRSPFFDARTKKYVLILLSKFSHLPLLGFFFKSLNEYIPYWQQTYFYLWSA